MTTPDATQRPSGDTPAPAPASLSAAPSVARGFRGLKQLQVFPTDDASAAGRDLFCIAPSPPTGANPCSPKTPPAQSCPPRDARRGTFTSALSASALRGPSPSSGRVSQQPQSLAVASAKGSDAAPLAPPTTPLTLCYEVVDGDRDDSDDAGPATATTETTPAARSKQMSWSGCSHAAGRSAAHASVTTAAPTKSSSSGGRTVLCRWVSGARTCQETAQPATADEFIRAAHAAYAADAGGSHDGDQPPSRATLDAALRALVDILLELDCVSTSAAAAAQQASKVGSLGRSPLPHHRASDGGGGGAVAQNWQQVLSNVAKVRRAKKRATAVAGTASPAQPVATPAAAAGATPLMLDDPDPVTDDGSDSDFDLNLLPSAAAVVMDEDGEVAGGFASPGLRAMDQAFVGSDINPPSLSAEMPLESPQAEAVITRRAVVEGDIADDSSDDDDSHDAGGFDDGTMGEVNQFVLLEQLGRGAQGEVFLAMDTESGELRAVKAVERPAEGVRLNVARRRKVEALASEVSIMQRLKHRNVVRLHEVIDDPAQAKLFLVLQYVEHGPVASVSSEGVASKTVEPVLLAAYARQLCAGLSYLHRNGVIHRDVKPENILVGANEHVFLADFGVSEAFDEAVANRVVTGTRGTPAFLAPELLQVGLELRKQHSSLRRSPLLIAADGATASPIFDATNTSLLSTDEARAEAAAAVSHVDGEAVDVWALGITLYVLLYGKLPWEFTDAQDLFEAIQRRPIELRPQAALMRSQAHVSSVLPSPFARPARIASGSFLSAATGAPPLPNASGTVLHESWHPAAWALPPAGQNVSTASSSSWEKAGSPTNVVSCPVPAVPQATGDSARAVVDVAPAPPLPTFHDSPSRTATDAALPPRPTPAGLLSLADDPAMLGSYAGSGGRSLTRPQRSGNAFMSSTSVMPSASADEGWRRILHGMLQRDPKRRTKLPELRRQFALLEQRMEEAERLQLRRSMPQVGGHGVMAFTQRHR